jgi:PAS domain S-box-containing protein
MTAPSDFELMAELTALRQKVEELSEEKENLETLLEMTMEHSYTMEEELYGKAEAALEESVKYFRIIVEAMPVPVLISRVASGEIIYANAMANSWTALLRENLIGYNVSQFYDNRSHRETLLAARSQQEQINNYELRLKRIDGTPVWAKVSLRLLTFNDEACLLSAIHDITERKQAEELLEEYNQMLEEQVEQRTAELGQAIAEAEEARALAEEASKAKGTFLANMSHELRTPLNAILGFAQVMTRSQTLSRQNKEYLQIMSRSGEHLLTLINNILDISKIEAGKTTLNEKNFDLYRLLDDLENMFHLRAKDKHLQLIFERALDLTQYVRTDDIKLRQVLINLLNNALKFTQQGSVSLRVASKEIEDDDSYLSFEVQDTGVGIAPEELDQLFEAFMQTQSGQQAGEGTGLGLPISRKLVQLMGGKMSVDSQVLSGTTFKFNIKLTKIESNQFESEPPNRRVMALAPEQPRYRLLIVDDKWTNRYLLLTMLRPLDFSVREASNGQEAVEIWEEWQPHLIWMDIRMARMDGCEATKRIKAAQKGMPFDNELISSKVIALTASSLEEEQAVLEAGCMIFYTNLSEKPIFLR